MQFFPGNIHTVVSAIDQGADEIKDYRFGAGHKLT
jgi:hypothetical protein